MNKAASRVKPQTLIEILLTIPMIAGLVVVVPYGIESAAMVLLIFNILFLLASYYLLNSYSKLGWNKLIKNLTPSSILVGTMCFALYILDSFLYVDNVWLRLVLSVFVGGSVYGIFFLLLPFGQLKFLREQFIIKLAKYLSFKKLKMQ